MPLYISNPGTYSIYLNDLGRVVINGGESNHDLEIEFKEDVLKKSKDLYNNLLNGSLIALIIKF
jgi:hypothetical protein